MRRVLLLLVAAISLAQAAPSTAAVAAAQEEETWTSPTYGFVVSWDPAVWQEDRAEGFVAQGANQLDRLLLSGPGNLWVEGVRDYGGIAGDCVQGELSTLGQDPSLNSVAERDDLAADGPGVSADAFEATIAPEGEEPVRIAYYVECVSLTDESVAIFTLLTVSDLLPDALALARPVIDSLAAGATAVDAAAMPIDAATFAEWVALVDGSGPVSGPLGGSLVLEPGAASAALAGTGVSESDFVTRLRWQNPAEGDLWDVGVAFRDQPDGSHYRLTFDATGAWAFGIGTGDKIASGDVPSMNLAPGGANGLELVVSGSRAGFAVNGAFVAELDVAAIDTPGDVTFGSGFVAANAVDGVSVNYRDFAVWSLAGLGLERADAPMTPGSPQPPDQVATPAATPTLPLPPVLEPSGGSLSEDGAPRIVAIEVESVGDSGVSGLATLTEVDDDARLNLVLRGSSGGEIAVIHEGTCDALAPDPAFLLEDPDASGRSTSALGVPRADVLSDEYAIAVHRSADAFGEVVACGELPG